MRRCAGLLVILCLALGSWAWGANAPLSDKARLLFDYQSYMRGDRDGAVRFSLTAVRELLGTPLAELAVRMALFYETSTLSSVDVGEAEARRMLGDETGISPELRDILRRYIARSLASAGRRDEAMEIHRRRGLGMSWLVAGPFTSRKAASFHSREVPEAGPVEETDPLINPPTAATFRQWIKHPPWRPVPDNRSFPFVRPWRLSGRGVDGAMLLFSTVDMHDPDNAAAFHIYSETSWRLYINGALAAEVDKNNTEVPIEHMVPFPLGAGVHSVMLQVFPPRVDLSAESVRVAVRLESNSAFVWDHKRVNPADVPAAPSVRRDARRLRFLTELHAAMNDSPLMTAAYGLACFEQGLSDEADWWCESAARSEPNEVNYKFMAGWATSLNPLLPEERRRDNAVAWYKNALGLKPDLVPPLLYLAELEINRGNARASAEYLRTAHAVNPTSIDVLLARGAWATKFASGTTATAAWDEAGKAYPTSAAVQLAIATLPHEGFLDMDRRLAACRAAATSGPYMADASLLLAEALADSGNQQEAEYVLRDAFSVFTGDPFVLESIAEVYARLSLYREAIDILAQAVRINPDNARLWRRLGDLHMENKDQETAVRMWQTSLAANPGQFELADMVNYFLGKKESIVTTIQYDAIQLTADAVVSSYPGDVIRLLDRSLVRMAADGSYWRVTHEIDLAKTRSGGESLTSIDAKGELLTARIVFPNGNTLEPEPYPGLGGLRLPAIIPGAAREIRSIQAVPASPSGPPPITPWFFQDPNGQTPFLVSDYVVQVPRGFSLVCVVRNLGNNVDFEKTEEGEFDTYRWTATLTLPSHEPDAVHISERVPSVEIGMRTNWDDIVYNELRQLEGRLVPSMRMKRLLATLSQNFADRPDPVQMTREIYRYVCDNIDASATGGSAAHINIERMGDRSLLLLALLRAAGLDAQPAAARPNPSRLYPPTWELPSRDMFTVPIVRVAIPGGVTYHLDVRFDSLPFGTITDDLSGATVLAFLPSGPLFETLPSLPAEESLVTEERYLGLPEQGEAMNVSGRIVRRGVQGLLRGESLAESDTETRKRKALASLFSIFPDAVLQDFEVLRADGAEPSSQERYEITTRVPLEYRPDGLIGVPLCFPPLRIISDEARTMPSRRTACHIDAEHIAEDRNIFSLPENATFASLPEPTQIPSRFGIYQIRVQRLGQTRVEVVRNFHIPAQRIQPWEWQEFLSFLERMDLAEKQWLVYSGPIGNL